MLYYNAMIDDVVYISKKWGNLHALRVTTYTYTQQTQVTLLGNFNFNIGVACDPDHFFLGSIQIL